MVRALFLLGLFASAVALVGLLLAQDRKSKVEQARAENIKDVRRMQTLVTEVREVLEEDQHNVLSLQNLKRLDEIEKLSKDVRGRLARK